MKHCLQISARVVLALWLAIAPAWAGSMMLLGVGGGSVATFTGLGDTSDGSGALLYWSCARAYTASYANAHSNMCEVTRQSDNATCTLTAASTGFADLTSSLCSGSTQTIVQFCNATTCGVDKAFDQTGNGNHGTIGTPGTFSTLMPIMAFSSPNSGSLPVMNCTGATSCAVNSANFTRAQPYTVSGVYIRNGGATTSGMVLGASNVLVSVGPATTSGNAAVNAGTQQAASAAETTWHSIQGVIQGSGNACAINIDGSDTASLACGTNALSASAIRTHRNNAGAQLNGYIAEAAWFNSAKNATARGNLSTNQHGSSGYNF